MMVMTEMEERICGVCGIKFSAPTAFMNDCRKQGPAKSFYCPNGHPRVFYESEATKLRRQLDVVKQQLAEKDDEINSARKQISAAKGQVMKLKTRANAGVCPCCNRTVRQMALHMKTKHPNFRAEAVA